MAVKMLISGVAGAGKTSLIKPLSNVLVISHDGKSPTLKLPTRYIRSFDTSAELIASTNEAILGYKDKYGTYPTTIVFDSVSRIFDTIYDSCNRRFTGFNIYSELDKEIKAFNSYLEETLIASDMNVVIISHAIYDSEEAKYNLVGKGSFAKVGGYYGTVDQAAFVEMKSGKRIIHFRSAKFPARTLTDSLPDSVNVDDFNLQDHLDLLSADMNELNDFAV